MNWFVSAIVFMIIINGSAGFLMDIMPNVFGQDNINSAFPHAANYGETGISAMNGTLSPESLLEDESNAFDRLLDAVSLGYFRRAQNFINGYLFGFPTMLEKIFADAWPSSLTFLLNSVISVLYAFTIVWLFTNKVFNKS